MSGKNFMSYGDADTILTEFSNDIKSRVSTKANQGLTSQQQANAKANIDIDKVPNVATNDQTPTFLEESTRTNIASGDKLSLIFGKIKKFFSDLKAVAFSGSYNDLSDTPTASDIGALPLAGGTMTGTTSYTANKIAENYRPEHSSYYTTTAYMTDGNEALVWATKNAVTSFMFVNGEDLVTNVSGSRWRSLIPGLQIKNNKVAINKLIDTNVTPSHNLDVNGDICCTYHDGTTLKTGNRSYGEHNCNNMVTNGFYYYTSNGPSTSLGASTNDGGVFVQAYSDVWVGQIAIDYRNGRCFFRGKNNGTWSAWQAFKSQADVDSAYSSGRTQGQNDVKNSPGSYGLYTKAQYDANYKSGWNLRVEKFWTNSSPNSSFSTMDINLSSGKLTQYQFIFIRFKLTTSLSQYENIIGINTSNFTKYTISVTNIGNISNVMAYAFVEGSYSVWRPIQYVTPSTTRDGIRIERPIVITGNSDGSVKAVYQTNGTHHGYLIPLEAYGVKAAK